MTDGIGLPPFFFFKISLQIIIFLKNIKNEKIYNKNYMF